MGEEGEDILDLLAGRYFRFLTTKAQRHKVFTKSKIPRFNRFLDVFSGWTEMVEPRQVTQRARSLAHRGGRRRLARA
jgi:hypothetical protein